MAKNRLFISVLFFFLVACCASTIFAAEASDISGKWQGNWHSNYGQSGSLAADISQSGTVLSGNLTVWGTSCGNFYNLPLTGTITGNVASFNATAYCAADGSSNILRYTNGLLNANILSGNYSVYSDGEFWDSGSYSLNRSVNIINATAGAGGTISPSGTVSVTAGTNQTFTIQPDSGYAVSDVKVDGVSVGGVSQYTFSNISANHTIAATFVTKPTAQVALTPLLSLLLGTKTQLQLPAIALDKTSVAFSVIGTASPSAQTVAITNSGGGTLSGLAVNISYGNGQPTGWLATSLSSTTAPATLSLQATTSGLAVGSYTANVTVNSSVAANTPQNIAVTFTVLPLPAGPVLSVPAVSGNQITLTWTFSWPGGLASTNDAYLLEESTTSSDSGFVQIGSYYTHSSPYTLNLTRSQGTYFYRVRARTYPLGLTAYSAVRSAIIAPPSGPSALKITNDLYSGVDAYQNDWGRLNTVLSLRVGPTQDSVLSGNGAYELLQPSDSVYDIDYAKQIQPGQQQTFDVSQYGFSSDYYVLIWLGWWELYCSPPNYTFCYWKKHFSSVVDCLGNVEYGNKWAVVHVYPPFGSPEEISTSNYLPSTSWYGTSYCQ